MQELYKTIRGCLLITWYVLLVLSIFCSLSYPARKAQASYFIACPDLTKFSTLFHKRNDFRGKKLRDIKRVFWFSQQLRAVWNISTSKTVSARYCHKYANAFMWSTRYSCRNIRKLDSSGQIFEKYSNAKYHENPSSGSRDVSCGRTNGHNETNSRFSGFCKPTSNGKISVLYSSKHSALRM
jgi:hypothetical protein